MSGKKLALERVCGETRLAVLEQGKLVAHYNAQSSGELINGNIYVGRVQNLVKGMSAAFVDIGRNRNGILRMEDVQAELRDKLHPGQLLPVQVERVGSGNKGPRLKTGISLPGRLSVLLPGLRYAGVSKKLEDEERRECLFTIAATLSARHNAGIIIRTEAADATQEQIEADYRRLLAVWEDIGTRASHASEPCLLYDNGDPALLAVRDFLDDSVDAVCTDDAQLFRELCACAELWAPQYVQCIELIPCETPLFDLLRVDQQLDEALSRRVPLASGGNIVIDEAEALTVIDVNTAKFTGQHKLRETALRLNLEAAEEIARQLRLRDLGGIIIVDFIDMEAEKDREALLTHFRKAVAGDSNRVNILGMTALGLVELTRKRERLSLLQQRTQECPSCRGRGRVESADSVVRRAIRSLWCRRRQGDNSAYRIVTGDRVAQRLRGMDLSSLAPVRIDVRGRDSDFDLRIDDETE